MKILTSFVVAILIAQSSVSAQVYKVPFLVDDTYLAIKNTIIAIRTGIRTVKTANNTISYFEEKSKNNNQYSPEMSEENSAFYSYPAQVRQQIDPNFPQFDFPNDTNQREKSMANREISMKITYNFIQKYSQEDLFREAQRLSDFRSKQSLGYEKLLQLNRNFYTEDQFKELLQMIDTLEKERNPMTLFYLGSYQSDQSTRANLTINILKRKKFKAFPTTNSKDIKSVQVRRPEISL